MVGMLIALAILLPLPIVIVAAVLARRPPTPAPLEDSEHLRRQRAMARLPQRNDGTPTRLDRLPAHG